MRYDNEPENRAYIERLAARGREMVDELDEAAGLWGCYVRTSGQLRADIERVSEAERAAGAKALADGLPTEEMLALRHEQLARRAYAEKLRLELAERQRSDLIRKTEGEQICSPVFSAGDVAEMVKVHHAVGG
jgi:hypothetical protein